jgi:hypothetical protein
LRNPLTQPFVGILKEILRKTAFPRDVSRCNPNATDT